MGYYKESVLKFSYNTYDEFLEYVMGYFESKNDPFKSTIELENEFESIDVDNMGDVCIRVYAKHNSYLNKAIEGFIDYLVEEDREEDYNMASLGDDYEDMEMSGMYDDLCLYRGIDTCMTSPTKIKPGTLMIDVHFIEEGDE